MVEIRKGSGKKWDYALGVEFGVAAHKAGGFFKGANIPAIPLRPFFWPVYRLAKRFYKRRIGDAMKRAIRKTVQS